MSEQSDDDAAIVEAIVEARRRDDRWPPVHWPSMTADEAAEEWPALFAWTEQLRVRYPNGVRIPDCWYHHNDVVEALSALRDLERACFAKTSSPTAALDWQRALRDVENRMDIWIRRFGCAVPGRGHGTPALPRMQPPGWQEFVQSDIEHRSIEPD